MNLTNVFFTYILIVFNRTSISFAHIKNLIYQFSRFMESQSSKDLRTNSFSQHTFAFGFRSCNTWSTTQRKPLNFTSWNNLALHQQWCVVINIRLDLGHKLMDDFEISSSSFFLSFLRLWRRIIIKIKALKMVNRYFRLLKVQWNHQTSWNHCKYFVSFFLYVSMQQRSYN